MRRLIALSEKGLLNKNAQRWFDTPKSEMEFYDLKKDPFELNNLADKASYNKKILQFNNLLEEWKTHTAIIFKKEQESNRQELNQTVHSLVHKMEAQLRKLHDKLTAHKHPDAKEERARMAESHEQLDAKEEETFEQAVRKTLDE